MTLESVEDVMVESTCLRYFEAVSGDRFKLKSAYLTAVCAPSITTSAVAAPRRRKPSASEAALRLLDTTWVLVMAAVLGVNMFIFYFTLLELDIQRFIS